jgi:NADP-dependent 3-hydroxy acid dehydrogenase YdfG
MSKVVAVLGVGPGIGHAVALRFARENFAVALMARSPEKLEAVASEIKQLNNAASTLTIATDARDPDSIKLAFETIHKQLGPVNVLVYNAGAFKYGSVLDIKPDEFTDLWKSNCLGAFSAAQQVLPSMVERSSGTILLTGATASLRGGANFSGLAVGKFGLRALAQSLAREFGPKGIHVAHIIIDGQVDLERLMKACPERTHDSFLSSDGIAEEYWNLYKQNKTTWTLEMDLRPYVEKF